MENKNKTCENAESYPEEQDVGCPEVKLLRKMGTPMSYHRTQFIGGFIRVLSDFHFIPLSVQAISL